MSRKPKPVRVYRQEQFSPTGGSTRQTFDVRQYDGWVEAYSRPEMTGSGTRSRFYVGEIDWRLDHDTESEASA